MPLPTIFALEPRRPTRQPSSFRGRPIRTPNRFLPALVGAMMVILVGLVAAAPADAKKPRDPEELFNPLLGIDYSHWLVGPNVEIATEAEVDRYLTLTSDQDAESFIEAFWEKRSQGIGVFDKKPKQIFEERAAEADKRFSEGTYPGRRTARGTYLILFGEPDEILFETPDRIDVPTLEVWKYSKDSEAGLTGKKPKKQYRFVRIESSVVLYTGQTLRPNLRRRAGRRN